MKGLLKISSRRILNTLRVFNVNPKAVNKSEIHRPHDFFSMSDSTGYQRIVNDSSANTGRNIKFPTFGLGVRKSTASSLSTDPQFQAKKYGE